MFYLKILLSYLLLQIMTVFGAREAPTVDIPEQGKITGTFLKMYRTQRVIAYMGIPYAQPPIGDLRFKPPYVMPMPSWDGVKNGSDMPPDCWQNTKKQDPKHAEVFKKLLNKVIDADILINTNDRQYDEDCLYLNVFVPDGPMPPDGYGVIVWLHSGDFSRGSPFELNPHQMVFKQKVIVVTVAYRLSVLGFFTSLDGESPGNYGLMDQAAALHWVNRHIELFGGNNETITLMGHGSGAISASLHLTSMWTSDMFRKVILMSGNSLAENAVKGPMYYMQALDKIALDFGCYRKPTSLLLECLKRLTAKDIIEKGPDLNWGPVVDGGFSNDTQPFIEISPLMLIERGSLRKVPTMIGFTDMEEAFDILPEDMLESGINSEMYETLLSEQVYNDFIKNENNETESMCSGNSHVVTEAVNFLYKPYPPTADPIMLRKFYLDFVNDRNYMAPAIKLADHMSKLADTYVYRFDIKPRTMLEDLPEWAGMPHGFEQIFIWGLPYWGTQANIQWDTSDKRLSDIIMTLWANFVKHTNPTQVGVYIRWETFSHESPSLLIIDKSFNMSDLNSLNYRAIQFWNTYYPNVLSFATSCCNMSSYYDSGSSIPTKTIYSSVPIFLISFLLLYNLPLT